jgi:phosphatidylglycerophosphate synthase
MLDGVSRKLLDPALENMARRLNAVGCKPAFLTIMGAVAGVLCAVSIALQFSTFLILFGLMISRLCDGLDGPLARLQGPTAFGAFLDIVCDFIFYGAIPLGFAMADPANNAIPAAILLFSFYINGATFLAFAAVAARIGGVPERRGPKGIVYSAGLAEGTETIAVFIAMFVLPDWFAPIAYAFAAICAISAVSRIILAAHLFDGDRKQ